MITGFKLFEKEKEKFLGIKKGDIVVFTATGGSRLDYGRKYIVNSVNRLYGDKTIKIDKVESNSDFITVKELNGTVITDRDNDDMLFYAYRFLPEYDSDVNKYNL